MKRNNGIGYLSSIAGTAAMCVLSGRAADNTVTNEMYGFGVRGGPPAEAVYSFGSRLHGEGRHYGDLDTWQFHATYVETFPANEHLNVLLGADWRRVQAGVPTGAPIPKTLQSASFVVGAAWQFNQQWESRFEVLPGVYSDFEDFSSDDINAPFSIEVNYRASIHLTLGVQASVDARRELPALAFPIVRWSFGDRWLLSASIPRPQLEYQATETITAFAGAQFNGGTYVVSDHFGRRRGRAGLDGQAVDFQEIRAGAGFRFNVARRLTAEISGGWTFDRRYNFYDRNFELKTDGAPFVQAGLQWHF